MKLEKAKYHFIGIGGIGMCGLAELLHNIGALVQGSDSAENANTDRLRNLGVRIFKGHQADNVGNADVVVYSSAIGMNNPEIQQARAKGIPLIPRAEALAEIMRLKRGIAVAGTHGKTTTTSMVSSIFLHAEMSPTIVVGGRLELIKSTALLGSGEWLVAEADESDGSFHKLSPEVVIITNIDSDHLDHFKTFENLQNAFYEFAIKIPFYGQAIVCGDDPMVRELYKVFPKRILFYGKDSQNDLILEGGAGNYKVFQKVEAVSSGRSFLGTFTNPVPGEHNALNALAAIAAGMAAGLSFKTCAEGLQKFTGVDRRFHFKGEAKGIKVYDDYGHHPTEVRATLQGFRERFPKNRLLVYFQPHRYSRTQHCWHDFTTSFALADEVLMGDIYPAGELPLPEITTPRLVSEMKHKNVSHFPKSNTWAQHIVEKLQPGDVFVTLGAGDGWKLGMEVLDLLCKSERK